MSSAAGTLRWRPAALYLDALAPAVADGVRALGSVAGSGSVRVASIDPTLADTAAFCAAYDVSPDASVNCVVVKARRGETVTMAAVLVLATDRADINTVVRQRLSARKISFADQAQVEEATGMQRGGITPLGLPLAWPVLIDTKVVTAGLVVVGAGVRGAKVLMDGALLALLPNADVLQIAAPRA